MLRSSASRFVAAATACPRPSIRVPSSIASVEIRPPSASTRACSSTSSCRKDHNKHTMSKSVEELGKIQHPQQKEDGHVVPPYTGWKGETPSSEGGNEEGYMLRPPYFWQSDDFQVDWTAACWCGKVRLEYMGFPFDAKHCHCDACKKLHGAPFQWAALFFKHQVRLHHSTDPLYLDFFSTQKRDSEHNVPCKLSCRQCRSPLFDEGRRVVLAYPSSFDFKDRQVPTEFAPTCHIFYGEALIEVSDGVPKWSGHKDDSELMPEVAGKAGALGHGTAGKHRRGQSGDRDQEVAKKTQKQEHNVAAME